MPGGASRRAAGRAGAPGAGAAAAAGSNSSAADAAAAAAARPARRRRYHVQQQYQQPQLEQQRQQPWSHNGHHPALEALNNATKWTVSCLAFGTLIWRRDLLAAWCVLGSVVAAVNCRILKYAINEARPSDRKADPGMPSAHAQSLGFLATFVSLAAAASLGTSAPLGLALVLGVPSLGIFLVSGAGCLFSLLVKYGPAVGLFCVLGLPSLGIILTWLRVALGYHTVPQVVVGWLVGSASAAAWQQWGHHSVLPHALQHPQLQAQLFGATAAAVAFFIYQNVRRWAREAREHRQLTSGGSGEWL